MSEMTICIWRSTEEPRAMRGRHVNGCEDSACRGCQDCIEPHCLVCGVIHKLGVCPSCLGEARDNLWELARLMSRVGYEIRQRPKAPRYGDLADVPAGELMYLAAPVADPSYHAAKATIALHRGGASHLDDEHDHDGEHPHLTLMWWEEKWRTLRGQELDVPAMIGDVTYLDDVLTWAGNEEPHFNEFARDLRRQVTRVEDALLDGIRHETGAPCLKCGKHQIKDFGETAADDRWKCAHCNRFVEPGEYDRSVANDARRYADRLTATDMELEYRIKPSTLTSWATKKLVRKRGKADNGRQLYDVKDALVQRDGKDKDDVA